MRKIIFSDVTARDGLQSLKKIFNVNERVKLINQLSDCFFDEIEVGSLINPKIIPTMENSLQVYKETLDTSKFKSFLLVGNKNYIREINENNIKYFSLFSSPSNQFNKHNINTDVDGSFNRFSEIISLLENRNNHYIKGYISCIGECPYEGDIEIEKILYTVQKYIELGVNEICLADTIGTLEPDKLNDLLDKVCKIYDCNLISLHLHTENELTTNKWKENLKTAVNNNICKFDTSLLGIGGCPAAYSCDSKKTGNLNILHAVSFFKELGYDVGKFGDKKWYDKIIKIENDWKPLLT